MSSEKDRSILKEEAEDGDVVQEAMGQFGPWQIIICIAVSFSKIPVAWHQLAIIFLAPPQEFWCERPPSFHNSSIALWRNATKGLGNCQQHNVVDAQLPDGEHSSETAIIPCTKWEFDTSIFSNTIVAEWQLVCREEVLVHVSQTIFMFGILSGNFVFGVLSDRYGRKPPLLLSVVLQVVAGITTALSTNYTMFSVFRFLDAFATGGAMITSFVIIMEIVGKKWRTLISVVFHIPFAVGHLTLPAIAYFFRSWRDFQLAISVPSILLLSYFWLVPESPRWLLSVGRLESATKILHTAAKKNNLSPTTVSEFLVKRAKIGGPGNALEKASFLDLLRYPNLRLKTLCISFIWLVCGVCFFGLAQYMGTIAGNIFINVAAAGAIEIPGSFVCMYVIEKFGRKKSLTGSLLLVSSACLLVVFVPRVEGAAVWPTVVLSTLGIVGMSIAFPTAYLFSGELFPTVVRNVGVGFASMCARIGSMAAPFITGLGSYSSCLPPLVFGVFPLVGCLLCLFLPETANTVLPETIVDGEKAGVKLKDEKDTTGIVNDSYKHELEVTKF